MKTRVIFNPASGHNPRHPERVAAIRAFIQRHRISADLVVTTAPGHATELARGAVAEGCTLVAAAGGDGTLNEVARALVGTSAVLALVPCGSGNGLALHLGIPTRWERALDLLLPGYGSTQVIDCGTANGHPFFNVMGVGFDAEISRSFNALTRRGLPAYVRTGLSVFARHRAERLEIESGGVTTSLDAFLLTVANSSQYGNNARIAPHARVDDGELDLVAVPPMGAFAALPVVARLFAGKLDRCRRLHCVRGKRFVIRRLAPGVMHVDGETRAADREIEVSVMPACVRVAVPMATVRAGTPIALPLPTAARG